MKINVQKMLAQIDGKNAEVEKLLPYFLSG